MSSKVYLHLACFGFLCNLFLHFGRHLLFFLGKSHQLVSNGGLNSTVSGSRHTTPARSFTPWLVEMNLVWVKLMQNIHPPRVFSQRWEGSLSSDSTRLKLWKKWQKRAAYPRLCELRECLSSFSCGDGIRTSSLKKYNHVVVSQYWFQNLHDCASCWFYKWLHPAQSWVNRSVIE